MNKGSPHVASVGWNRIPVLLWTTGVTWGLPPHLWAPASAPVPQGNTDCADIIRIRSSCVAWAM